MYKMTKILVTLILFSIPILGKDDWTKNKKAIAASIKKHQKALIPLLLPMDPVDPELGS